MKLATILSIGAMAMGGLAMAKGYDWDGPKDMSQGCGDAIVAKLAADKYVGEYLNEKQTISLEWWDKEKTAVSFTSNFGEDVRDGYITGEIAVSVKSGGYCVVKEVINSSVGD